MTRAVSVLIFLALTAPLAQAKFFPACLKPDGDWVHGLTKKECKQLRGRWQR